MARGGTNRLVLEIIESGTWSWLSQYGSALWNDYVGAGTPYPTFSQWYNGSTYSGFPDPVEVRHLHRQTLTAYDEKFRYDSGSDKALHQLIGTLEVYDSWTILNGAGGPFTYTSTLANRQFVPAIAGTEPSAFCGAGVGVYNHYHAIEQYQLMGEDLEFRNLNRTVILPGGEKVVCVGGINPSVHGSGATGVGTIQGAYNTYYRGQNKFRVKCVVADQDGASLIKRIVLSFGPLTYEAGYQAEDYAPYFQAFDTPLDREFVFPIIYRRRVLGISSPSNPSYSEQHPESKKVYPVALGLTDVKSVFSPSSFGQAQPPDLKDEFSAGDAYDIRYRPRHQYHPDAAVTNANLYQVRLDSSRDIGASISWSVLSGGGSISGNDLIASGSATFQGDITTSAKVQPYRWLRLPFSVSSPLSVSLVVTDGSRSLKFNITLSGSETFVDLINPDEINGSSPSSYPDIEKQYGVDDTRGSRFSGIDTITIVYLTFSSATVTASSIPKGVVRYNAKHRGVGRYLVNVLPPGFPAAYGGQQCYGVVDGKPGLSYRKLTALSPLLTARQVLSRLQTNEGIVLVTSNEGSTPASWLEMPNWTLLSFAAFDSSLQRTDFDNATTWWLKVSKLVSSVFYPTCVWYPETAASPVNIEYLWGALSLGKAVPDARDVVHAENSRGWSVDYPTDQAYGWGQKSLPYIHKGLASSIVHYIPAHATPRDSVSDSYNGEDGSVFAVAFAASGVSVSAPSNDALEDGSYDAVFVRGGDVWYKKSSCSPAGGWDREVQVTSTADTNFPIVFTRFDLRKYIVYQRSGLGAYYKVSDDEGATWSAEVSVIANGYYPDAVSNKDGDVIFSALVYNAGTSGPGKIKAKFQAAGDTALSSLYTFKDTTGADLVFADTSFKLISLHEGSARWVLHCKIDGETDTSHWASANHDGSTWRRIA